MDASSLVELKAVSEKLAKEHSSYEEEHLPSLVSKGKELHDSCDNALQVVERFLELHKSLQEAVGNTDRVTQEIAAWLSSHQRFGHPESISQTIDEIQVFIYLYVKRVVLC